MTEEEFAQLLESVLNDLRYGQEIYSDTYPEFENGNVSTYDEKGVLTMNKGLIIRLQTGEEFQITILRSK